MYDIKDNHSEFEQFSSSEITINLSDMYSRDLASISAGSNQTEDTFLLSQLETEHTTEILEPLIKSTTILPQSFSSFDDLDSNILLFNNNEYSSQSELLYSYSNLKNDEVKEITGTGEVDTKRFKLSIEGEEEEEDKFSKRKKASQNCIETLSSTKERIGKATY